MPTTREEIPISSIVLNTANFRHRPVDSQEGAFAELFREKDDRSEMLALATDIAANELDPSSLFIVEPVDGYWRVLEGNRRVASIKAMANPDLIPDQPDVTERTMSAYREKFAKLGAVAQPPRTVLSVVTDNQDLAKHLIELKHTGLGYHKGAGTKIWGTEGRNRFEQAQSGETPGQRQGTSNSQTADAIALLDALSVHFEGDEEMTELIARGRKKGYTTIGRLLRTTENQLRLGVQIDGQHVRFLVDRASVRAAMARMLTDVGTKVLNSRTRNTTKQLSDYLDDVQADLPTARDRLKSPEGASPPPQPPTPRSRRTKQTPVMRKPFLGMTLYHASDKTRAFLKEMKELRIDDHAYVLSVCIRTLIDLYTADVYRALKVAQEDSPSKRTRKCLVACRR